MAFAACLPRTAPFTNGKNNHKLSARQSLSCTRGGIRVRAKAASQQPEGASKVAAEPVANLNVCATCGVDKSKAPGGCDGQGRVVGGMGALPGFGWWPIKAYKPCSALYAAGLDYERKGQVTNEVLFGGVSLGPQGAQSLDEMKRTTEKGLKLK